MTIKTKRLNKAMTDNIKAAVIRDTFKARLEVLLEQEFDLALKMYENAVSKEHRDIMATLPAEYFSRVNYAKATASDGYGVQHGYGLRHPLRDADKGMYLVIMGSAPRGDSYGFRLKDCKPIPNSLMYGYWPQISDKALLEQIESWSKSYRTLFDEARELELKVFSTLSASKTVKALLETWPECKPYIPEYAFASEDRTLPAIVIADLNAAIAKAKGEAATVTDVAATAVNELAKEAA